LKNTNLEIACACNYEINFLGFMLSSWCIPVTEMIIIIASVDRLDLHIQDSNIMGIKKNPETHTHLCVNCLKRRI